MSTPPEKAIPGADSENLARAIRQHGHRDVTYVRSVEVTEALLSRARTGRCVVTIGAGNITQTAPEFCERSKKSTETMFQVQ